jgi:Tol biopolymer transport system component
MSSNGRPRQPRARAPREEEHPRSPRPDDAARADGDGDEAEPVTALVVAASGEPAARAVARQGGEAERDSTSEIIPADTLYPAALVPPADIRDRLATYAAVPEAPAPRRLALPEPAGPRVLTWRDRLLRFLLVAPAPTVSPRLERRRAATAGLISGATIGGTLGLATLAWHDPDAGNTVVLAVLALLTTVVLWWRTRSTSAAAIHLGLVLGMLWVLTPATRIVYQSDRDTGHRPQIYITTATGGSTDRLTSSPTLETGARLSPNGRLLALAHYQDGSTDIYVTDADGSAPRNLTRHPGEDRAPAWSPDGQEIAFQSNRAGNWDIYVMQSDGRNVRKLTSNLADDQAPAWSPDGRTLVFQSDRGGFTHLYVLGQRGSVLQLTHGGAHDRLPAWSPDGQEIAFQSNRDGRWQLYAVRANGGPPRRILASEANDMMPAWSPDGRWLVFASDRAGNLDLYMARADGTRLHRLTATPTHESHPSWTAAGPVTWLALQRLFTGGLGLLLPAMRPADSLTTIAPPAPREDAPADANRPALPDADILPGATPRPALAPPPGGIAPTPTPGPRPVPTCAPGSFWC